MNVGSTHAAIIFDMRVVRPLLFVWAWFSQEDLVALSPACTSQGAAEVLGIRLGTTACWDRYG